MVDPFVDVVAREQVRDRAAEIERQIDQKAYRPGPWDKLLREARALPREDRAALKDDFSRISSKLHRREGRSTISFTAGLIAEVALTAIGVVLVIVAIHSHSNLFAIVAAAIWMMTFQPLLKIGVGYLFGVEYEYTYFYGVEPRFKMRFGDYLAAPRWGRIALHLSGTIGSPLGVWLVLVCLPIDLRIAIDVCWAIFWVVVVINLVSFFVALFGKRSVGPFKASYSSGGSAALELREALEI